MSNATNEELMDTLPADPTVPAYAVTGEPEWVASSLVRGMETMPVTWND